MAEQTPSRHTPQGAPLSQPQPDNPRFWGVGRVAKWIAGLRIPDAHKYGRVFEEQEVDGNVLLDLSHQDLINYLGVKKLGRREKILGAVEKLKGNHNIYDFAPTIKTPSPRPPQFEHLAPRQSPVSQAPPRQSPASQAPRTPSPAAKARQIQPPPKTSEQQVRRKHSVAQSTPEDSPREASAIPQHDSMNVDTPPRSAGTPKRRRNKADTTEIKAQEPNILPPEEQEKSDESHTTSPKVRPDKSIRQKRPREEKRPAVPAKKQKNSSGTALHIIIKGRTPLPDCAFRVKPRTRIKKVLAGYVTSKRLGQYASEIIISLTENGEIVNLNMTAEFVKLENGGLLYARMKHRVIKPIE